MSSRVRIELFCLARRGDLCATHPIGGSARLSEIPQVGRLLVLAQRHQVSVGAAEVALFADDDVIVRLGAEIFGPDRIALAIVVAHHRPWARECVVDGGDLGMQEIVVGLIEKDALLDDCAVVLVQRQAIGIEIAWAVEVAGLDLEQVVAAVPVLVDPSPDGIAPH
jgi:hypothetical protein